MGPKRPAFLHPTPGRVALVLAGGAARGAYEIGVVQHIAEEVSRDLGRDPPFDIICGTSVGAINGCALAALADAPHSRARKLVEQWRALKLADVVRLHPLYLARFTASLLGKPTLVKDVSGKRYGGLIDPSGMEKIIIDSIPFDRIGEHVRSGLLHGVTVSTTHISTGTTVVFVAKQNPGPLNWSRDRKVLAQCTELSIEHALASAAIPLMFPAVRIGDGFYCDGGLRQNVPLSPARHLGADGMLVISPRYTYEAPLSPPPETEPLLPGPWFLIGKALNALLLDRVENDIDRMRRINTILLASKRRYGSGYLDELNEELGLTHTEHTLRPVTHILIEASENIGRLALEHVRTPAFAARNSGPLGRLIKRLTEGEESDESDILSYILFDGDFADQLIAMGRRDARARHQELCRFFTELSPE